MHALIRTSLGRGRGNDSLAYSALAAWRANSSYPVDGLELGGFGVCPGIPFRDKVQTLKNGHWQTVPHDPRNFNTQYLDIDADDAAQRHLEVVFGNHADSLLMRFLHSTLDEDQQVVFRRWLGYHLLSNRLPNAEKMLYLWGSGANGKSQLLWLVRSLVGPDACAELRLADLRTSANIEKLVGKLAMVGSEATTSTEIETLKALISREPLNCNPKYRDPFTVAPECLITQASNYPPHFDEKSDAMSRRVIEMHLKNSFLDEATRREDIAQEIIQAEYPILVGLALWGAEELSEHGRLVIPDAIARQSVSAVEGGNQLNAFADSLEFGPYEVAYDELYDCYVRWCREEGVTRTAVARRVLIEEVIRMAAKRKRTVQRLVRATHYTPSNWTTETGETAPVHPKLNGKSRIDTLCGVRVSADLFGIAVGQPMPPSRQNTHLFADEPAAA
jgi:putative DNA primase/helicase